MTTTYSIHRAEDHAIMAIATPGNLQQVASNVAMQLATSAVPGSTRRAYVHNGTGIVAAGLCRGGLWHDTLRENYQPFEPKARAEREAYGLTND